MATVASNFATVRARIASIATRAGRRDEIKLIAVSKKQTAETIEAALRAGQRVFGENYVQEAAEKFPALREKYPDIELHMIGHLQSNKAEEAVRLFDVIQTLDRPSLAEALGKALQKSGRKLRLYLEVNSGQEAQKGGLLVQEVPSFLALCRTTYGLEVEGLMCIPPAKEDPALSFLELRDLARTLDLPRVSMGMSADYRTAILCGATDVRVGTALFGERLNLQRAYDAANAKKTPE